MKEVVVMRSVATGMVVAWVAFAAGCSSSGSNGTTTGTASTGGTTGGTGTFTFTMAPGGITNGGTFSPASITVPAGATIVFNNTDTIQHTATAEAAAGNFSPGSAPGGWNFDVHPMGGMSSSITVPSNIASGTVQPFYCGIHRAMMVPSDPTIHIQ
jgi:plastocyanin